MDNLIEVDVLVIGAGPAGSIAARESSKNGANTLIIEKKSEIGTPKRCAEGITLEAFKKLELVDDDRYIARRIEGARIISPDGTDVRFTPDNLDVPAEGIILERKVFDKHLTIDAIRNGAKVMVKTEAKSMERVDDGFIVKAKTFPDEEIQIKVHIIIGADGPEGHVGSWAGINTKVPIDEMEGGAQYEMANLDLVNNRLIEFYFGSMAPGGYAWIFPKGYDSANVGIDVSPTKATKNALEYLDDFINNCEYTKNAQIVEVNVGGNPLCGVFEQIITDNVMLVGDAAGCISPITGGGIDTAIESGMMAGRVAAKAIKEKDYTEERLKEYSDYVDENIGQKFKKYLTIRDFLYDLSDDDLNEYVGAINKANIKNLSTKALVKALLKVSPRKLFKLRKLL